MTELNDTSNPDSKESKKIFEITDSGVKGQSFSIGDTRGFGAYTGQGIVYHIKVPFAVKYLTLR